MYQQTVVRKGTVLFLWIKDTYVLVPIVMYIMFEIPEFPLKWLGLKIYCI